MLDTKERILLTAERLFAENGYAPTSLRSIISEAGVNLAAVHYHFRAKESLLEAIITRRVEPVNEERLALLERYEKEAAGGAVPLERILEAFLAPTFAIASDPERGGQTFVKLMGRLYGEGEMLPKIIRSRFQPLLTRFGEALAKALPELSRAELYWRIHFAIGAMAHTLRSSHDLQMASGGLCRADEPEAVMERLIAFLSAGLRAPVPAAAIQEK